MLYLPYFIIIAGTGRNTGKTFLASTLLQKFSAQKKITALKISPHFHTKTPSLRKISGNDSFDLYEETSGFSEKDTSKMLLAGAFVVYYIETTDTGLPEAFNAFMEQIQPDTPVIVESPVLRKLVKPGIFLIVDKPGNQSKKEEIMKWKSKADYFIDTDNENLTYIASLITLEASGWELHTIS